MSHKESHSDEAHGLLPSLAHSRDEASPPLLPDMSRLSPSIDLLGEISPMLQDDANMGSLRRDVPPSNPARAGPASPTGGDSWQPVPVEPAVVRKPVGSPSLRKNTSRRPDFNSGKDDEEEYFATRDGSGAGHSRTRTQDAIPLTAGHGRSGSTSSTPTPTHSRQPSIASPGYFPYASNSPGHARTNSNPTTPGHAWYGSTPPTPGTYRPSLNPPTPPKGSITSPSESPYLGQRSDPSGALLSGPPNRDGGLVYYPPGYQPGPDGAAPSPTPKRASWFLRYWLPHYSMYLLLATGVLFAVGHHLFYRDLDGQDATNQILHLRYGAALSFLSKASLAAATVTAFRQRVWMTVRQKVLSLAAVDSLFAATEDLPSLFNIELFRQAKLAMLLALYVWCTPLVVIFASQTLVVEPLTVVQETKCPSVRSFNFAHEGTNSWREPAEVEEMIQLSLSFWNATTTEEEPDNPNSFDYWIAPSQPIEQVGTLAAYLKAPVMRDNAATDICSSGWNCTFTIDFVGPGYKCTELASGVGSEVRTLHGLEPPFGTDDLAPVTNTTYMAQAFEGEYHDEQVVTVGGGVPAEGPPYPKNLGALRTEPVIWVGYAAVDDPSRPQPGSPDDPRWDEAYTPKIFGCEHYETRYNVQFTYNSSLQHTEIKEREYLRPVIDTTLLRGVLPDDGTLDNTTAVPEENYVLPTDDIERYRVVAAYHSLGNVFRKIVNGTIVEPWHVTKTTLTQTRLVEGRSWLPVADFMDALPTLYEDMILSMLSNPRFLSVVWAADPDEMSGTAKGGRETEFPCTRYRTANRYKYHVADLWAVYTVAVLLCLLAVGYGTYAVMEEGVTRTTRFSAIAAATRGPALEKVPWGGGDPGAVWYAPGEASRVRVGYGVVVSRGTNGFGVEGDVVQGAAKRRWTMRRSRVEGDAQGEEA